MYQETSSNTAPPNKAEPLTVLAPDAENPLETPASASPGGTISPSLEKQIVAIEQRLVSLKGNSANDLVDDLTSFAKEAVESADAAISAAHYAIVHAWATGSLLNLAKEALGHGRFGAWRDAKASEIGISKRKAQQWMKIAKDCWDVRALLVPGATLTGVYRATGVLPEPAPVAQGENDDDDDGDDPSPPPDTPSRVEPVFKTLTEGRMRLRHLIESGTILVDKDRDRLEVEKSAYLTLFDKLLNPIIP